MTSLKDLLVPFKYIVEIFTYCKGFLGELVLYLPSILSAAIVIFCGIFVVRFIFSK